MSASALLCAALALGGCATGGADAHRPDADVARGLTSDGGAAPRPMVSWGEEPPAALAALLELATTNNLSILQAVQRVEASRAALAGSRAEYWPSVGFSAATSKAKTYNPDGTSERSSLGFDASWELDLFGKVRRAVEASRAELEATEYSLADALVTLRAEISAEYVNLWLQRRLLDVASRNLDAQRELADIAKSRFDAGLTTELDWLSAKAQLHTAEAAIPATEANAAGCLRRLELLCGLPPGELEGWAASSPVASSSPDGGVAPIQRGAGAAEAPAIPSDLLRRRPDVLRAERAYAAALARVGVAKASYYPSVSIGAGLSLSSDAFASWGDAMRSISFGPSVNWSILSFGRTKARVAQARAQAEEASLAYREAVLNAFHEVEDAVTALDRDTRRQAPVESAYEAQKEADALALKLYREDLGEYRDAIAARQSLLSQERSLAELRANLELSRIALDKALAR